MYSRISFSSRPTVETKYPRAQKLSPVKFLGFPINVRAMWIALFPFIVPDHLRYRILGRNRYQHMHMVAPEVPFFYPAPSLHCPLLEHFSQWLAKSTVQRLLAIFRDVHNGVFAFPLCMA